MGKRAFNVTHNFKELKLFFSGKNRKHGKLIALTGTTGLVVATASAFWVGPPTNAGEHSIDNTPTTTTTEVQPQNITHSQMSTSGTSDTSGDQKQSGNSSNASTTHTSVTVNGQLVPVPENGSTQQTITNPDGSTVNVSVSNQHTTDAPTPGSFSSSTSFTSSNSSSTNSSVNVQFNNNQGGQ